MKSLRKFLPVLLAFIAMGCTHNDGDIGPWFGSWAMPAMTVDGDTPPGFDPVATVWEFQSEVVRIGLLDDHHDFAATAWGTWREADGRLYLDFTHGNGEYTAPSWLLMHPGKVLVLSIVERENRRMVLRYITPKGESVVYTLKKTW